jgi:hypothetical protein
MNKSFLILLVIVLILGAGYGGAFAGGVAFGKTQQDDSSAASPRLGGQQPGGNREGIRDGTSGFADGSSGRGGRGDGQAPAGATAGNRGFGDGLGGAAGGGDGSGGSGEPVGLGGTTTSDATATSDATTGDSRPSGGFGGGRRGGLTGTVTSQEGDLLTIDTPQGESQQVQLTPDLTVQKTVEGSAEDLTEGVQVRVIGQPDGEGTVQAQTIIIVPEGTSAFFGGGGRGDGSRRGGNR